MATVIADMSMSLDGFIANREDGVGPLFDWYNVGPVTTPSADPRWSFHTSQASAKELLEDPSVTAGTRVTHLQYRVQKRRS